jgi:hypothetical protein
MGSFASSHRLPTLLLVGMLISSLAGVSLVAAKQKPRPPKPGASFSPPSSTNNKSSLTGEKVTLTWDDFTRRESPPSNQRKSAEIHSLAYTLASYHIATSLEWTQLTARSPRIWRISAVNLQVKIQADRSWVRESLFATDNDSPAKKANKEAILTRLLEHEQGHYDIVATMARDLYHDLLALKEFNSDVELQRKIDELQSAADNQIESLNRKYDDQCGDIGRDHDNQTRWTRLLVQAKEGKRLTSLFAEPPAPKRPSD